MSGRALFIGGPGTISRGAIGELVEAGWDVRVLTHPKDPIPDIGARFLWGDRDDGAALRAACDEVQPDVVIDTCCYTTGQVTQALDVFAAPGRQYVFVSTVDVFGYPLSHLPVRESDEHGEPNSPYALAKRDCETLVKAASAEGRMAVTIIRPGYSMGPRFVIGFFSRQGGRTMLRRLKEGRPIVVPGDGSTLFQPGTGVDTGRLMARVVGEPRAYGGVFTCAGPQVITHDAYVEAMAAVVGVSPRLIHIPVDLLLSLDPAEVDSTIVDESILPVLTRFDLAYSSDAILELGGSFEPQVSTREAIASHLAWLDEQGWPDTTEGPDDRLIRRHERARTAFLAPGDGMIRGDQTGSRAADSGGSNVAGDSARDIVERALADGGGILRLEAAWVAREWTAPGRRLGLPEERVVVGERGWICERWLGSTTKADHRIGPDDEGLSYLALEGGHRITLRDAVQQMPGTLMGSEYAATHRGLDRLAKIFDVDSRVPFHLHPRQQHASLVGRNQKDEAYWYPPDVDMGPHPESFFGLHASTGEPGNHERLLPYLIEWDSDRILEQSKAFFPVAEGGFHIPSGVLHAPGTALTFELQEDSDVLLMFQALNVGKIVSKDLMFKDVRPEDREQYGERFLLQTVDWEANCDPYFYENHHLGPRLIEASRQPGGEEYWIYYDTLKFSGKKLTVAPGQAYSSIDRGVYNLLVWRGRGTFAGLPVDSRDPNLDELLVSHDRAVRPIEVVNTGDEEMVIIKFFGPDINPDVPMISRHRAS